MTDMPEPRSPRLIFRDAPQGLTVAEFRTTIDSLNNAYEFLSIGIVPGYEGYPLSDRVSRRVTSRLIEPDELRITALTYGSPLVLALQSYVPYVIEGLATFLGGVGFQHILKDGGDGLATLLNLRTNVRSKNAKFKAEIAKSHAETVAYQLEQARSEKTLEAIRKSSKAYRRPVDRRQDNNQDAPPAVKTPLRIEAEREQVEMAGDLVQHEVKTVIRIAGIPEID